MMIRGITLLALTAASFSASTVYGQNPPNINKEQSRLALDMPGLENAREIYQHWQAGKVGLQRYYAALISRDGPFPRAQVYFTELGPNYYWRAPETINETWIRNLAPFLENQHIEMRSATTDATGELKLARFEIDEADCVAFAREMKINTRTIELTKERISRHIHGFFCGSVGTKLTSSTIAAIISNIQVKDVTGKSVTAIHVSSIPFGMPTDRVTESAAFDREDAGPDWRFAD